MNWSTRYESREWLSITVFWCAALAAGLSLWGLMPEGVPVEPWEEPWGKVLAAFLLEPLVIGIFTCEWD